MHAGHRWQSQNHDERSRSSPCGLAVLDMGGSSSGLTHQTTSRNLLLEPTRPARARMQAPRASMNQWAGEGAYVLRRPPSERCTQCPNHEEWSGW